jgi:hypothetical protein
MIDDEHREPTPEVRRFLRDIASALAQLMQTDPLAFEKYRNDPQYQDDVHEHARLARALADKTKTAERANLLQSESARRQYEIDEGFRDAVEERAIRSAIDLLNAQAEEPDEDDTRH